MNYARKYIFTTLALCSLAGSIGAGPFLSFSFPLVHCTWHNNQATISCNREAVGLFALCTGLALWGTAWFFWKYTKIATAKCTKKDLQIRGLERNIDEHETQIKTSTEANQTLAEQNEAAAAECTQKDIQISGLKKQVVESTSRITQLTQENQELTQRNQASQMPPDPQARTELLREIRARYEETEKILEGMRDPLEELIANASHRQADTTTP